MNADKTVLYDYWRSTASYRVRIALNLIGIEYETVPIDLLSNEQQSVEHLARNPQGFVPVLEIDGLRLTQSIAIIDYLDETRHANFLPSDAVGRARVRGLAHIIAMDTHPICNPSVVNQMLAHVEKQDQDEARARWMQHFIRRGLAAFEKALDHSSALAFCHGDQPGLADICLIPQLYNADRWSVGYADLHRISKVSVECAKISAFVGAEPRCDS